METELHLQACLRDLPLLSYCIALEKRIPYQSQTVTFTDTLPTKMVLTPPTLIPKFDFPVYPVELSESEQLMKYPSSPSWRHVKALSLISDLNETGPVVFGEFSLKEDSVFIDDDSLTGVERSLKAWETATVKIYNENENYVMDSMLYALLPPKDSRFTVVPERFAPRPSFSLSFSVSKSSDVTDTTKSKRNRKRQREGGDAEEKTTPGSIGTYLHHRMQRSLVWSKKEDEMLMTLVMQFGPSWLFVCWVFLQEQLNHRSRQRAHCSQRWTFLQRSNIPVSATIPAEAKYLYIPHRVLSTQRNIFAKRTEESVSPTHKRDTMEEEVSGPFADIFSAVRTRNVTSALQQCPRLSDSSITKLKERDAFFAAEEADRNKRLQRLMRPEQPQPPHGKDIRRNSTSRTSQSQPNSVTSVVETKPQSGRVTVRPIPLEHPPNYLELRRQAIANLPLVRITIEDESKFQHLLQPSRTPQQSIVVPYGQVLSAAARIQEDLRRQAQNHTEQVDTKNEMDSVISTSSPPFGTQSDQMVRETDEVDEPTGFTLVTEPPSLTQVKNELKDLSAEETMILPMNAELADFLKAPKPVVAEPEEKPQELPPVRVKYPYLRLVEEISQQSEDRKRPPEPLPAEESMNLKRQKLPPSVERRLRRIQPSIIPHSFYHSVPQLVRSNVRLLQQNLTLLKQQKNPKVFQQTVNPRKDVSQGEVAIDSGFYV